MNHSVKNIILKYTVILLFCVGLCICLVGILIELNKQNNVTEEPLSSFIEQLNEATLMENESKTSTGETDEIVEIGASQVSEVNEDSANQLDETKVNINTATVEQLQQLKGIGPSKAQAIIEERERGGPFASIEDILRVKGIGNKTFESIKESLVN